jgi:hypothetical protein
VFATAFGLSLTVVTPEELQGGGRAESRIKLNGTWYDAKKLYEQMAVVYRRWSKDAAAAEVDPGAPWNAKGAAALDARSLADILLEEERKWKTAKDVCQAIQLDFELTTPPPPRTRAGWLCSLSFVPEAKNWLSLKTPRSSGARGATMHWRRN